MNEKNHLCRQGRRLWTKARAGALDLRMEEGRRKMMPLITRICRLCKHKRQIELIEDEFHVIMICEEYHLERRKMIGEIQGLIERNWYNIDYDRWLEDKTTVFHHLLSGFSNGDVVLSKEEQRQSVFNSFAFFLYSLMMRREKTLKSLNLDK